MRKHFWVYFGLSVAAAFLGSAAAITIARSEEGYRHWAGLREGMHEGIGEARGRVCHHGSMAKRMGFCHHGMPAGPQAG